jgi:hypothetical protein
MHNMHTVLVPHHGTVALGAECFTLHRKEQAIRKAIPAFLTSARPFHPKATKTHLADETFLMPLASHCIHRHVWNRFLASFTLWLV